MLILSGTLFSPPGFFLLALSPVQLEQIPPETETRIRFFLAISSRTHSPSLVKDHLQSPTNPSHLPVPEDGASLELPSIPAARNQPEFQVRSQIPGMEGLWLLPFGSGHAQPALRWDRGHWDLSNTSLTVAPRGDLGSGKDLFIKPRQQESNPGPGGPATCG